MAVNVFEGARRVCWIVLVGVALGGGAMSFMDSPYISATYYVPTLWAPATSVGSCSEDDATEVLEVKSPSGRQVRVEFCFKAARANNGKMLIPYDFSEDGSEILLRDQYSSEISNYTDAYVSRFKMPESDLAKLDGKWWKGKFWTVLEGLFFTFVTIIALWIFFAAIGWIARGFLGVQSNKDSSA